VSPDTKPKSKNPERLKKIWGKVGNNRYICWPNTSTACVELQSPFWITASKWLKSQSLFWIVTFSFPWTCSLIVTARIRALPVSARILKFFCDFYLNHLSLYMSCTPGGFLWVLCPISWVLPHDLLPWPPLSAYLPCRILEVLHLTICCNNCLHRRSVMPF
jgi:hypothetical protein